MVSTFISTKLVDTLLVRTFAELFNLFFLKGYITRSVKNTAIALIPKSNHAKSILDFRPISLCNTLYKIIAKILAARLKHIMPQIINASQAGFINKRISTDNVILGSEILGFFKRCGRSNYMCAKLDIKKAFDSVSREFILLRLAQKGIPQEFIDDVLVFGKANVNNCNTLTNLLSKFASSSGLVVNTHKSTLIMHPNTPNSNDICAALNIPQSHTKITYLGIPISIKKPSIIDFSPLIDVISNKLSGWKAMLLSFVGRLQFLRYTIWNTIAYWIRGAIIPKSCCKQIDKLASRFLYSGDANAKKLHLISWRNTCKPKVAGGLGLPSLNAIRFANSCSIISRMYNFPSLLANWFFHNYSSPWKPAGCLDSPMWKQICDTALNVKRNFAFKINVGSPISLMWDHWCWGDCLSSLPHVSGLKDLFPLNSNISVIMDGTVWQIPSFISDPILSRILSIPIHQDGAVLYWNNGKIGRYSDFLSEFYSNDTVVGWHKVLWHKRAALRFSVFGWLSLVGGLKTADVLIKRCISVNPICCLCYSNVENVSHLYFECDYTHAIIAKLIPALNTFLLRPNLHQIVDFLADGNFILLGKRTFYPLLLWCTVYYIWRERNSRKFGNKFCSSTTTRHLIIKAVSQKIKSWKDGDIYQDILKRMH
ncbi:Putative ribonuclease H protein [Dendrobium catenatum]|uniref:Ribonuclease H protein n=1 Tax=Dendrobium catenatum TaxID=906689 RepID=A0A2I0WS48_9ASPA|nr:Putative ribonuclease H protein [Dendrobium catenatum]